jgi:adenylate cyclase
MQFRIGINLGDVMVDGDDVYGDGVNIAARLQQLAEPGGILISGSVYDQVHNKLSIGFDRIGPKQVKNVANPILSYRVVQGDAAPRPARVPEPLRTSSTGDPLTRAWQWFIHLPRPIAVILALTGFFFVINLFSGFDDIWFHWPAAPLLLIVVLWAVIRRKPR